MKRPRSILIRHSVQARLLVMLVVLSLPLLVVSFLQLDSYEREVHEHARIIAQAQTNAASAVLEGWLREHPVYVGGQVPLSGEDARDLFARIRRTSGISADAALVIRDKANRIIHDPASTSAESNAAGTMPLGASAPLLKNSSATSNESSMFPWNDATRSMEVVASTRQIEPAGWSLFVALPPNESTPAGRSRMWLAATWALALSASILLALWATSRFTGPLRSLAAVASTVGEGRLNTRAVVETKDEIGTLASSFNQMAESLQARFDEVQKQGSFIKEVLYNLPLGVVVLDDRLTVRTANPTFAKFVGRSYVKLEGRGLYEAAAGLARLRDIVEDVRRTRQPFISYGLPLELVARNREEQNGTVLLEVNESQAYWDVILFPTTEQGLERGDLILILNEVSSRVRAEKLASVAFAAERARAAELAGIIEQMNDGVVIVDRRGLYRINPAAATILGRARAEFRDGVEALVEDMAYRDIEGRLLDLDATPLMRALKKGESISGEQYKIKRAKKNDDGSEERVLAVSATPLIGENDEREGAVAVFRDITTSVRSHNELLEAYARLREHDRLKTAFVANISHELRTPLNVILGLCQVLERDRRAPLTNFQRDSIERMERNARNLLALVNDLLDYSRLEAGRAALHMETVDLAGVIRQAVAEYLPNIEQKNINFVTKIEPEVAQVYTDRRKLVQVVANLVSNAVKFTSEGEVRVYAKQLDAHRWLLEVSDTGIGIAPDEQQFIFDEFRQVEDSLVRRYGGTGLGLAITRKIVELLDGELSVESVPDHGSKFRAVLSRHPQLRTGTGSLFSKSEEATQAVSDAKSSDAPASLAQQHLRARAV